MGHTGVGRDCLRARCAVYISGHLQPEFVQAVLPMSSNLSIFCMALRNSAWQSAHAKKQSKMSTLVRLAQIFRTKDVRYDRCTSGFVDGSGQDDYGFK